MMALFTAMPRQGHLDPLYHVSAFLKKKDNYEMAFGPTDPNFCDDQFAREDWNDTVYGKFNEDLPPYVPQGRGFRFKMRAFVDADHARDSVTH